MKGQSLNSCKSKIFQRQRKDNIMVDKSEYFSINIRDVPLKEVNIVHVLTRGMDGEAVSYPNQQIRS